MHLHKKHNNQKSQLLYSFEKDLKPRANVPLSQQRPADVGTRPAPNVRALLDAAKPTSVKNVPLSLQSPVVVGRVRGSNIAAAARSKHVGATPTESSTPEDEDEIKMV